MLNPLSQTVNGHEFWMLPVEGGRFQMGSSEGDEEAYYHEKPQHEVMLGDFFMGKFPVTQALWRAVATATNEGVTKSHPLISLEPSPSYFKGDVLPVEQVSWDDIQAFHSKIKSSYKRYSAERILAIACQQQLNGNMLYGADNTTTRAIDTQAVTD